VPLAVITITLDPVLQLSDTSSVRYETIALAIVLFIGLLLAARIGARTPSGVGADPDAGLRIDDLAFITVGAVPGAIVGGRLGYVLDHLEFYRANPGAILDAAQGGLTLSLAVPFGILTGALIARLLGAPVGRWMHAAAAPLLFILSAGKLVGVLGATGQGAPADLVWATAYAGPGPWGSLAPETAAHPSQLYEAALAAAAVLVLAVASRSHLVGSRTGAAMFVALVAWALARLVAATTWRDPAILGALRMDQVLALLLVGIGLVGLFLRFRADIRQAAPRTGGSYANATKPGELT
jgi:phosphatidylglycerol:prolipoprotein diacylglycerol transferase